jgi:hypothetical protein
VKNKNPAAMRNIPLVEKETLKAVLFRSEEVVK